MKAFANMENDHMFVVIKKEDSIEINETYNWKNYNPDDTGMDNLLRLVVPKSKWTEDVEKAVVGEFKRQVCKKTGNIAYAVPNARFAKDDTGFNPDFGEQLMVLLWAIQDCVHSKIDDAVLNWSGLQPEERRWLYHMANSRTGGIDDGNRGWRMALKYALCDNPV